ncbi:hypothetical protein FHS52_003232 [Erythromicrobium ramosum]|uniref:Uncharacterized protein n=1 Tax=Erythrobacter ramosus TaxID=35811 RepID=A0ABR6I373_9SPHN|nr:hypothetical protein [Erythrobacter ramosus]MBB3777235.1 hypothetical protein [Erythrobacter ramosus]
MKNVILAASGKLDRHFTALWDGGRIKFFSVATLSVLLCRLALSIFVSQEPGAFRARQVDDLQRAQALSVFRSGTNEGPVPVALHVFSSKSRRCSCISRSIWLNARRRAIASRVYNSLVSAFWLPMGAPDPLAPPCIRHRSFSRTAGERHGVPDRVFAPQRALAIIGRVLRG